MLGTGQAKLTLGELLGATCLVQTSLLALHDASVAGQEASLLQGGAVRITIDSVQSAGNAQADCASLAGGADNSHFVQWVYHNIAGVFPDTNTAASLKSLLDQGVFTQASMLSAIAELPVNQLNVNLVGLAQNGMDYF